MSENNAITRVSFNHLTLHTDILIDAPPAQVWQVLTDFAKMPAWSTTRFEGDFRDGGKVSLFAPFMGRTVEVPHTIFVEEGTYFGWSERSSFGFHDDHRYIVEDAGNGQTRFIQSDKAEGGAAWLIGPLTLRMARNLYVTFNRELKAQVEKRKNSHTQTR